LKSQIKFKNVIYGLVYGESYGKNSLLVGTVTVCKNGGCAGKIISTFYFVLEKLEEM
jgi:hypothetical protein